MAAPSSERPRADDRVRVAALETWFATNARTLPWRRERTPYRVWVSEVMLQQTRAETVAPYFDRFLTRFPDVYALARADLEAVLKAWEGLGYYRRARLLHLAAKRVVDAHDGALPTTEAELRELPGFGPYTAAAVAALAFGRPTLAIDANVRRVGCRLLGLVTPDDDAIRAELGGWPGLASDPAAATEALIELGARICTPTSPECHACPLRTACRGAHLGTPEAFPTRCARRPAPTRRRYALACWDDRGVWLERRPVEGLLGGLWGFPQRDDAPTGTPLATVEHVYSHFRLELSVVATHEPPDEADGTLERVPWPQVAERPISGVDAKILEALAAARKGSGLHGHAL